MDDTIDLVNLTNASQEKKSVFLVGGSGREATHF